MNNQDQFRLNEQASSKQDRTTKNYLLLLGDTIVKKRKAKGYTQTEFAQMLGVPLIEVMHWEQGDVDYKISTLVKIAAALGLRLHNVFESLDEFSI